MSTKTDKVAAISEEVTETVRVYTIAREVDSNSIVLENSLNNLKREFGFDMEKEDITDFE